MILASGIMFVARSTGNILFLKRGSGGDHPGEWCFPGGHQEPDESIEECAIRESIEELGVIPRGDRPLGTRSISNKEVAGQTPQPTDPPTPLPEAMAVGNTPATDAIVIPGEKVSFTTFRQYIDEEFMPKLNGEHVGFSWAPASNPPEALHPGCRVALDRIGMNELGVAKAIRDGRLTSPQKYENLWLFAMRITGTGMAYRSEIASTDKDGKAIIGKEGKPVLLREAEFVWRDPALYMNDEFLERCNGLPVIWQHPKKKPMMDSKEFADRIIGSIMLPYLRPELEHPEVWGIAKVLDDDAAGAMIDEQLSTSPCVVFRGKGTTSKYRTEDGKIILVEGNPQLLDHLAVCPQGVWDKGGEPTGVQTDHHQHEEELIMADEAKKVEEKKDASEGAKLDKILSGLDSAMEKMDAMSARQDAQDAKMDAACARMDSFDKKDDKEDEKKDSAKKDGDENEKDKKEEAKDVVADKKDGDDEKKEEKADSKADSTEIRAQLADLERRMKPRSDADRALFATAQERADEAYSMFGDSAPRSMDGEELRDYRLRLLQKVQPHSVSFKDANLALVSDQTSFDAIEKHVYADAVKVAMSPESIPADQLRPFTRPDVTGRQITTFGGQPRAWMSNFGGNRRRLNSIRNAS